MCLYNLLFIFKVLGWLSEKLPQVKSLPPELKICVPLVLNCLEDRNGDVRKKAHEAIVPFMIHVGYECCFKAAAKCKVSLTLFYLSFPHILSIIHV